MLVRLFVLQCFLATTFLISDFALSIAPQPLLALLRFFELAGDAVNFENQAMNFGIRRLQSLAAVGQGFFFILLVCYNIRDFVGRRGLWLVPLALSILGIGLPSGHRWLWLVVGLTLVFSAYAQRFYSIGRMLIATALLSVVVPSIYIFAESRSRSRPGWMGMGQWK